MRIWSHILTNIWQILPYKIYLCHSKKNKNMFLPGALIIHVKGLQVWVVVNGMDPHSGWTVFWSQERFISFSLFFVETVTYYFSLSESILVVPYKLNILCIPTREESMSQQWETEREVWRIHPKENWWVTYDLDFGLSRIMGWFFFFNQSISFSFFHP